MGKPFCYFTNLECNDVIIHRVENYTQWQKAGNLAVSLGGNGWARRKFWKLGGNFSEEIFGV